MFAYGLIIIEIVFFAIAIAYVFHNNAPQYKVDKDIWGTYQRTESSQTQNEEGMVIVFSKNSTSVKVESQINSSDPNGPKGSPRNFKRAA